ncbi:MAG: HEAT repeat domain-containing protein [Deltaproteobacteria bacterium]|nr:MAG: HEAT repeat domain-containing protein [Deltaproteobacteria bacterium]
MGLFDYFSAEASGARKRKACLKKLSNMYYQKADRLAAAEMAADLAARGDREAIGVLLHRFEHLAPSTTNDREEKKFVHDLLVSLGEPAAEVTREFIRTTDNPVYWPLRVIRNLSGKDAYLDFLADLLRSMDTEYVRDPEKKRNLMMIADDHPHPDIHQALLPFVADEDETVRFNAIQTLANAQRADGVDGLRESLQPRLAGEEESLRVARRIAEIFAEQGWTIDEDAREAVASELHEDFKLVNGRVVRNAA